VHRISSAVSPSLSYCLTRRAVSGYVSPHETFFICIFQATALTCGPVVYFATSALRTVIVLSLCAWSVPYNWSMRIYKVDRVRSAWSVTHFVSVISRWKRYEPQLMISVMVISQSCSTNEIKNKIIEACALCASRKAYQFNDCANCTYECGYP